VWAIAFSWGFSPQSERMFTALAQQLPAGIASLVSMVPGLGLGVLCEYLCDGSLGKSWVVSLGLLAAVACGVCELGRRTAGGSD
jgi:protein-S-isoprenylcysteine O-methyltransferase Ste14